MKVTWVFRSVSEAALTENSRSAEKPTGRVGGKSVGEIGRKKEESFALAMALRCRGC
jgi:hypothetical protein